MNVHSFEKLSLFSSTEEQGLFQDAALCQITLIKQTSEGSFSCNLKEYFYFSL